MVVVDIKISTIITLDLPCFKVNGKKAICLKEQIECFVKEHPEAPLPIYLF